MPLQRLAVYLGHWWWMFLFKGTFERQWINRHWPQIRALYESGYRTYGRGGVVIHFTKPVGKGEYWTHYVGQIALIGLRFDELDAVIEEYDPVTDTIVVMIKLFMPAAIYIVRDVKPMPSIEAVFAI